MNVTPENPSVAAIRPPQLIQSLVSGFNAVANNIYLILLPVALDLLLWFGPHLRIKALMEPDFMDLLNMVRASSAAGMRPVWDNFESTIQPILEHFNIFSLLSTFPIGVPTLMAGRPPMQTPFGAPFFYEIQSYSQYALAWLVLSVLGLFLGSVYFASIARVCARPLAEAEIGSVGEAESGKPLAASLSAEKTASRLPPFRPGALAWQFLQILILIILLIGILLVLTIPAVVVTAILATFSPFIAWIALLLISLSAIWFMIPLVFSPHGIFMYGQSVLNAMLNSIRLVRYIMPGTGMFLLAAIVLNQGLGLLWETPPDASWMALVGIFGHAFVVTGLLAASFYYYRHGLNYVQALRRLMVKSI